MCLKSVTFLVPSADNVNIQFTLDIEIHCIYVDPVYLNMCFYLCFYTQLPRNQIPRDKCVGLSSQEAST